MSKKKAALVDLLLWYTEQFVTGNYESDDFSYALRVNLEVPEGVANLVGAEMARAFVADPAICRMVARNEVLLRVREAA